VSAPGGQKFDAGKFRFSDFLLGDLWLWPAEAFNEVCRVLVFGAAKYAPHDWAIVKDARRRYYDAGLRHRLAWYQGEERDPETGLHHLAHSVCCDAFLLALDLRRRAGKRKP